MKHKTPKIVLFDIETSLMVVSTFTLYPESISHNNLISDWHMICAAWKVLGEEHVHAVSCYTSDDKIICQKLRDVLADADIVVGHNSKKFDVKKLNARLIFHKLEPLPPLVQVDTLKEIKKIATFSSHRLDYLCKMLFGEGKLDHSSGLWIEALKGNKQAIKDMVAYNKVDVVRLEQLYSYLLPYMETHPHVGVMQDGDKSDCPKCGGLTVSNGLRVAATGVKKERRRCKDCGGYHTINYKQPK